MHLRILLDIGYSILHSYMVVTSYQYHNFFYNKNYLEKWKEILFMRKILRTGTAG